MFGISHQLTERTSIFVDRRLDDFACSRLERPFFVLVREVDIREDRYPTDIGITGCRFFFEPFAPAFAIAEPFPLH